jgi:hypothetical protein
VHFVIDEAKIEDEARYDGTYVLRTNTELYAAEVALQFKRQTPLDGRTMASQLQIAVGDAPDLSSLRRHDPRPLYQASDWFDRLRHDALVAND